MRPLRIGQMLRRCFLENVTAKVMALALALAIWLYAHNSSRVPAYDVAVPVSVTTSPGWTVVGPATRMLNVRLSYPRRFTGEFDHALRTQQTIVRCHVQPDDPGEDNQPKRIVLDSSHLVTPRGFNVQVERFKPDMLEVRLIRKAKSLIEVNVAHTAPPPGYEIVGEWKSPKRVNVRGRKDVISRAKFINTQEIDISQPPPEPNVKWTVPANMGVVPFVVLDDASTEYPVECDEQVLVQIVLRPIHKERVFKDIPIQILVPSDYPHKVEIVHPEDRNTDVHVQGPITVVNVLRREDILLFVETGPRPGEIPWAQLVKYKIGIPGGRFLNVEPVDKGCQVVVSERSPK